MNLSQALLEYLKQKSTATVEGFGTFSLANARAVVDSKSGVILPPAKQISFAADYNATDSGFIGFLTESHNFESENIPHTLTAQTDFWKKKIQAGQPFDMEPLGAFKSAGDQLEFFGNRISSESPDFYGLEAIKLADISSKSRPQSIAPEPYRLNRTLLYVLLLGLPLLGILGYLYLQPDAVFGKPSFDKNFIQKPAPAVKVDSFNIKKTVSDTLRSDSTRHDSLKTSAPAAQTPVAKRSGKKYKTSKWKQKKHQNHSR